MRLGSVFDTLGNYLRCNDIGLYLLVCVQKETLIMSDYW